MGANSQILPVYLTWDVSSVDKSSFLHVAYESIRTVLDPLHYRLNLQGQHIGPWWSLGPWGSAEWYLGQPKIKLSYDQIDGGELINLYLREQWQKHRPHLDIVIISDDMTVKVGDSWQDFVLGLTCWPATIISVYRFVEYAWSTGKSQLAHAAFSTVVIHEFGHLLGLANTSQSNLDMRDRLHDNHCQNVCVMRRIDSVEQAIELAQLLSDCSEKFCPDCQGQLLSLNAKARL